MPEKDNKEKGYIALWRSMQEHWIFNKPEYLRAWLIILFEVNHKDTKVLIDSDLITCNRGQSINSLDSWTSKFGTGWTKQKVRTFFALLKKDEMINTQGLRKTTRLTVCNYDSYQYQEHTDNTQNNTQLTHREHTANTQLTSNNNGNNLNNGNKKGFVKPKFEEISEYCKQRKNAVNAQSFLDHYESKGWMIGKNKMKDWKAAVRTWESRANGKSNNNLSTGQVVQHGNTEIEVPPWEQ